MKYLFERQTAVEGSCMQLVDDDASSSSREKVWVISSYLCIEGGTRV